MSEVKIDLKHFATEEEKLENFEYVERKWRFFRKEKVGVICFERAPIKLTESFVRKYYPSEGNTVVINFHELVDDLFKLFKKDPRNFWLKKEYLLQQSQEMCMLMTTFIAREHFAKSKKKTPGTARLSPTERYLATL